MGSMESGGWKGVLVLLCYCRCFTVCWGSCHPIWQKVFNFSLWQDQWSLTLPEGGQGSPQQSSGLCSACSDAGNSFPVQRRNMEVSSSFHSISCLKGAGANKNPFTVCLITSHPAMNSVLSPCCSLWYAEQLSVVAFHSLHFPFCFIFSPHFCVNWFVVKKKQTQNQNTVVSKLPRFLSDHWLYPDTY